MPPTHQPGNRHNSHDGHNQNASNQPNSTRHAGDSTRGRLSSRGLRQHAAAQLSRLSFGWLKPSARLLALLIAVAVAAGLVVFTRSSHAASVQAMVRSWFAAPPSQQKSSAPLVGEVTLTATAGTATGTFTTLGAAFTAINAGTHQGVIAISINADTAEGATTATLNASGTGSASYTSISIQPAGGAARTISGATTAGSPMIDFSGADNVTINGLNTGVNSLTIANTTVSATTITSTIRFIGGATNNTITNSNIQGSGTMSVATNGAIIFFSTDAVALTGNDNNTISNNNIGPAGANLPTKGILCNGSTTSTAIGNSGLVIDNNNIFDYFGAAVTSAGVAVNGGCNTFSITNNRFYQTATRTETTAALHSAINMNSSTATSGVQGMTITGNTIGYASNTQTGTYALTGAVAATFRAISFTGITLGTVSNINNNTIASISLTGVSSSGTSSSAPMIGIYVSNGVTNVNSNTIGSQGSTGSISYSSSSASTSDVDGLFNFGSDNWTTNSNNIGGITAANTSTGASNIYALRGNTTSSVSWTATGNTIGGTVANSIQSTTTSTSSIVNGIANLSANGTFTGNTIRNMTAAGGTGTTTSASVAGIVSSASSANHTVSQNTIHTLNNTAAATATTVTGIQFTASTGTNLIARNFLHSFNSASTTATINGIQVGGGTATYQNNMIRLGVDASGSSITTALAINGINEPAVGTDNFYFNSVFIGGTGVGTTVSNTVAFNSTQTAVTRAYQDNIFVNARSNSTTGGKHYAIKVGGTTTAPTGLTLNYNDYLVTGTGGIFGSYNGSDVTSFANWKSTSFAAGIGPGLDANSFNSDPQFLTPNGTSATVDLHINPSVTTVVEGNGLAIAGITDDFDGQTRASLTPTDIGADAGNFTGVDLTPPVITYTALANATNTTSRTLSISVTDASGVPTTGVGLPVLYYRKGVAGAYSSAQCTSTGGSNYDCVFTYSVLGGVVAGNTIQYYVAAQDSAATPNVTTNPSTGASGFTANPPAASTPTTAPNSFLIATAFTGTKTVCASGCDFTTLTGATGIFNGINSGVATGNINIEIAGDLIAGEDGSVALNPLAEEPAGSNFTVKIYPTGVPRLITSTTLPTGGFIRLNGADRVTIDGSIGGTGTDRSLTITEANTGTTSAVVWLQTNVADGATSNTIKNLNVVGNSNITTLIGIGMGSSTVGLASLGTGNNSNTIQNNNISKTQYGIYSQGASAAAKNTGNAINQNLINTVSPNNVQIGGIMVGFENAITISQNNIAGMNRGSSVFGIAAGFVTSDFSASTFTGNEVTNATITKNVVDNLTSTSTTGFSGVGIAYASAATGTTQISNNAISRVSDLATSPDFNAGIYVGGGAGSLQIYYNSVWLSGNRGTTASMPSYALAIGGATPTVDVRNNALENTSVSTNAAGKSYAIGLAYTSTLGNYANLTSNNNDFFTSGASSFFTKVGGLTTSGTDKTTLAAWNTETGRDNPSSPPNTSLSSDPVFNSTSDLRPQTGSPLVGAGISGTGVLTDLLGVTRSTGTPPSGSTIGAYENAVDSTGPVITYTAFGNTTSTANRVLAITVADTSGVPTSGAGLPVIYFRKGTSGAYSNTQCSFVSGSSYNCTIDYSLVGGVVTGNTIQYYVAAQDNVGNVSISPSAGASGLTANPPAASTPPTSPNSYLIASAISGTRTVCASGCDFTTLTGAAGIFNSINTGVATGNIEIQIAGDLVAGEDGTNGLNALAEEPSGSNFTVKIYPTGVARAITGSFAGALIRLNGSSRVTIDGSIGGTGTDRSLTIQNTSVTNPSVVLIGSTGTTTITTDALKNCVIRNGVNTSSAVVISDAGTLGNTGFFTNITIQNNDLQKAFIGVYANGGTTPQNGSNLTYTGNNLNTSGANAIRNLGLYMQGVNGATVSQNTIGNFDKTSDENDVGIWLATGTINATVSGNTVATLGYTGTGAFAPIGINLTSSVVSTSNNVTGNSVSDISSNGTTAVRGISVSGTTADLTIQKNNVQGVINTNTGTYGAYGMDISGGSNVVIKNNFISNINHDMTGGAAFSTTFGVFGIRVGSGSSIQVYHNSVNLYGPMTGTATTSLLSSAFALVSTGSQNCDVRDNVFANNITGGTTSIAHVSAYLPSGGTAAMNLTWNNNAYYFGTDAARQGVGQAGTTAGTNFFTTLAALKAYTSTLGNPTNDNASLAATTASPFFSNNDLHIARTAPAVLAAVENAGVFIAAAGNDFDNDTRDASTPDIGADEVMTVNFSATTYSPEVAGTTEGNTAMVTVNRTSGAGAAAVVNFTVGGGTATGGAACGVGVDYITPASLVLNFAAGDAAKSFNIVTCTDGVYEGGETVPLTLTTVTGDAIKGSPDTATVNIIDVDTAPTFSITSTVTHNEGNTGTTAFDFVVTKTGSTALTSTVRVDTADVSATAPSDYTAIVNQVLTFNAGDTVQTVTVLVNGDLTVEPTETFTVTLSNPTNATIASGQGTGTGTITNDDIAAPVLGTYPNPSVQLGANTTVAASAAPTDTTSINVSTNTKFNGTFAANLLTGDVYVTNASPAGVYLVTVKAFGPGGSTTKTFTLTVTTGTVCNGITSFTNAADVTVGSSSFHAAVGDVNNDGNQDLLVSNQSGSTVSVRLGAGDGTFSGTTNVSVGSSPKWIAVGDFNGDGKQDFATANGNGNTISVRLGVGDGTFTNAADINEGAATKPWGIAAGDFNGDGKQDLAITLAFQAVVDIRLGVGDGTFTSAGTVSVGTSPSSIAIGDFNADGKQDLAVGNRNSDTVSIRLGVGDGTFSGVTDISVGLAGSQPLWIALGDFNGDGKQDFVTANSQLHTLSVRLGDGAGNFGGTTEVSTGANTFPVSVAVGDLNNDGKQDLLTANSNTTTAGFAFGDGAGNFGASNTASVASQPQAVAIGDFNEDGKLDFAAPNNAGTMSVRLGACTPVVNLSVNTNTGSEAAATVVTVTATASDPVVGTQTVSLGVSGTGITAGDYTLSSSTITIPNGGTTGSVTFTVVDDSLYEGTETATLTISSPSAGIALGATTTQNVTITDNDTAPTISIGNANLSEGGGNMIFTVTQSAASGTNTTFTYSTADVSATAGLDYTGATNASGQINAGSTTTTISIPIIDDALYEGPETFTVTLSNPVNATITGGPGTGTINDNDNPPTNLVVNTTVDPGTGVCDVAECTLREAINAANALADANTINFNIPISMISGGVYTIQPTSALPTITRVVTIDGASQTVISDSNPNGPEIVVNGSLAPGTSGFLVSGNDVTIENLVINGFANGAGVAANNSVNPATINLQILNNYLGTNASGTAAVANSSGTDIHSASLATIRGNLISGNTGDGVVLCDANNSTINGNRIGTNAAETAGVPNGGQGIYLLCSNVNNTLIQTNTIAFNGSDGFRDQPDYNFGDNHHRNHLTQNAIYSNTGLGINLLPPPANTIDGVTPNDAMDPDTGANGLQNFPIITSATVTGTTRTITGTLNTNPNSSAGYTIEFFANVACDGTNGEGKIYLGSLTASTTNASGDVTPFTFHPASLTAGQVVTATASDSLGNTSEFSACFTVVAGTAGTIQFSSSTYSVGEGATPAVISVTRVGGSSGAITANFSTSNGTAVAPGDYGAVTNFPISYADGETGTKTVNVSIVDDSIYEANETVNLSLSSTTILSPDVIDVAPPSGTTATLTILDNDTAPTFSITSAVSHNEGNTGTTAYDFTVTKTGSTAVNPTVRVDTADVSATAPSDYTAIVNQVLTFLPADTMQTVTVLVNGDTTVEPDETFTVNLSNPGNATIASGQGTGTITNDDVAADYTVTTTGNAIVVTDVSGNGDTLTISEPSAGNIKFAAPGRTFSVDGGANISGDSGNLSLTGINSITVNAAAGADTINVDAFATSLPSLTINGGVGDDTVNFNGNITFNSNAILDVDLQNDDPSPGVDVAVFNNADLILSGTGSATVKVSKNIAFIGTGAADGVGSTLQTVNGAITLEANQQATGPGTFFGINVDDSIVQATGTGVVTLKGRGGNSGNSIGIGMASFALVKGGTTSGATTTSLTGNGGTGNNVHGLQIGADAMVTSFGGDVSVTGTAGAGGGISLGFILYPTGTITSGGTGNVTVSGTGGSGGANNDGIRVDGSLSKIAAGGSGTVNVTATGGAGVSPGLNLSRSAVITSTGGSVTVTGTHGTGGGSGILMNSNGTSTISAVPNGTVTLIADRMDLVAGFVTAINSGIVNIRQKTNNQQINLGGDDDAAQLGLKDAELDRVTAATMNIGDVNTGAVSVSAAITQTKTTNIFATGTTVLNGGDLGIFGTVNSTLTANSGGVVRPGSSPGVINSGNLSFASSSTYAVEIGGTTPGNGAGKHDQINVTGTVALGGSTLTLASSGGFTPTAGQTFTIINNDGNSDAVTGTFNGLPEGAIISGFLGSTLGGKISYVGGDGNDVVLTAVVADYTVTTTGNAIVVTDIAGNADTLAITEPSAGNIKFAAATRIFLVDGVTFITGDSGDISRTSVTSITVNQGNGSDTANVGAFTGTLPSLTINGGVGDDTVNFNGNITFASNANLDADLQNDDPTPGTDVASFAASANILLSGTGTATVKVSKNIAFNSASVLQVVNGNLTLEANQQAAPTTGTFIGVDVNGAMVQATATGAGVVTVSGRGGTVGAGNRGVLVRGGGLVKGGMTSGSMTTDVLGTGGSGGSNPHGVEVDPSSIITSFGGDVRVRGFAGTSTTANNYGVIPVNGGLITSGGNGNVVVQGTGGTNASGGNVGVIPHQSGTITSGGTGTVTVTGTGGNGPNSHGVQLFRDGRITSGGAGNVVVNGTASGAGSIGVFVNGLDNNSPGARINSGGGSITVNGTGTGGNLGLVLGGGGTNSIASVGNAAITLVADAMTLDGTGINDVNSGTGTTTLRQLTNTTAINLGGADGAGTLGLTDAELDLVTAGTLNIGDSNSGAITVSANISRGAATVLNLTSNANIDIAGGSLNSAGGNVTLTPGTNVFPSNSGVDVTTSATTTLSLTSAKDLKIVINNTTVDSGYTQLNVAGLVNLNGANLALSGSYTPVAGDMFTIVNNDSNDAITGNFNGLSQGATIPNFFGSGLNATITYAGGDGNDCVLTVVKANTTTTITSQSRTATLTGQNFDVFFSVAVSGPGSGTPAPTGNVMVSDGVNSCSGTVAAGSCTLALSTIGTRSITATYQGDGNYNASSPSASVSHSVSDTAVWNGSVDTGWANDANWTTGLTPQAIHKANIPSAGVTNEPKISTFVQIVSFTLASGRTLTIGIPGGTLLVNTSSDVAGTIVSGPPGLLPNTAAPESISDPFVTGSLNVTNAGGISIGVNTTVNVLLNLASGDLTMTGGAILAQPPSATSTGTFDVIGNVKRTGFTTSNNLSFGNPFNSIGFISGTLPTDITVNLVKAAPSGAQAFPGAVKRTYTITTNPANLTAFAATLRLHYVTGDLNGNNPTTLSLWRYDSSLPSPGWRPNPATARDCASGCTTNLSNFWVERAGVTGFSPWTLSSLVPTASDATITGRVTADDGSPVEGTVVRLSGGQSRMTITDATGNYHFDNVDTTGFYTVTPSRANFSFSPAQRSLNPLGAHTEAAFNASQSGSGANPLDTTEYFVRQQYLDFLNREPDEAGLNFWVNNIQSCGDDANCLAVKRIDTSAAFFLSIEFQQTGYLVYRTYQSAYGDMAGAPVPLRLIEFKPDTLKIGNGVVVNQTGWETVLENNKQAYLREFVERARFVAAYPAAMTPAEFVDKLFLNAGVTPAAGDRSAAIDEFGSASTSADNGARGRALRRVAENSELARQESNQAFVLMQYFGYLRRDANALPDTDFSGYNFWLEKLNSFNGNFREAEMVKAFLVAGEYRGRFPR